MENSYCLKLKDWKFINAEKMAMSFSIITVFFAPMIIMAFVYIRIYKCFKKRKQLIGVKKQACLSSDKKKDTIKNSMNNIPTTTGDFHLSHKKKQSKNTNFDKNITKCKKFGVRKISDFNFDEKNLLIDTTTHKTNDNRQAAKVIKHSRYSPKITTQLSNRRVKNTQKQKQILNEISEQRSDTKPKLGMVLGNTRKRSHSFSSVSLELKTQSKIDATKTLHRYKSDDRLVFSNRITMNKWQIDYKHTLNQHFLIDDSRNKTPGGEIQATNSQILSMSTDSPQCLDHFTSQSKTSMNKIQQKNKETMTKKSIIDLRYESKNSTTALEVDKRNKLVNNTPSRSKNTVNIPRYNRLQKQEINLLKTIVIVCLCFFVCYIFQVVRIIFYLFGYDVELNEDHRLYDIIDLVAFTNCAVNPFVYAFKYTLFREELDRYIIKPCRFKVLGV